MKKILIFLMFLIVSLSLVGCGEHEHVWDDGTIVKEAQCTTAGIKQYACVVAGCKETKTEDISATGHFEEIDQAVSATCLEKGFTEGKHCSACNEIFVAQDEISALGHDYEASYVWTGFECEITLTCKNDSTHVVSDEMSVTSAVIVEADCEAEGNKLYTATYEFDGKTYTDTKNETLSALGHDYEASYNWTGFECEITLTCKKDATHVVSKNMTITSEVILDAKCESNGDKLYTSTITQDGKTYTDTKNETLPALGHDYEATYVWTDFDCKITLTCKNNPSETITEDMVVDSEVNLEAGCETDGNRLYTATYEFDGKTYTDTKNETLPAFGHNEIDLEAREMTCGQTGLTEGKHCITCNTDTVPQTVTDITVDHSFVYSNGAYKCKNCQSDDYYTPGLKFQLNGDGTEYIVSQGTVNDSRYIIKVVIPSYYRGKPVTTIKTQGFNNCELEYLTIGENVKTIEERAFIGCSKLGFTELIIPKGVEVIGEDAFSGCSNLATIKVHEDNKVFDSRNNCNAIIETATNTIIYGCKNSTIPNTVTAIGDDAFNRCYQLTSITIPNSVTSIGKHAFEYCQNIETIIVPNSVTSIGEYAFYYCSKLKTATILANITTINKDTFKMCQKLETIVLPATLKVVELDAFKDCNALKKVLFMGSSTEWLTVTVRNSNYFNSKFINCEKEFNYTPA